MIYSGSPQGKMLAGDSGSPQGKMLAGELAYDLNTY